MNIIDQLTHLRTSTPGCALVALSDLSSGVVLCASSAIKQPQERLDSLCAIAADFLGGSAAQFASETLGLDQSTPIDRAIALNATNSRIFIRSRQEKNDALCCICSVNMDIDAFMNRAHATLKEIAAKQ